MKKNIRSLRWVLLAVGIIAVVGLTAMNVYSLYTLRNSSIESELKSKKIQVAEFADRIRHRFFQPFDGFSSVDMVNLEQTFAQTGQFPKDAADRLYEASKDSIFRNIYFIPVNSVACQNEQELLRFDPNTKQFTLSTDYLSMICDGLGIARTRMKALLPEYNFNNKVLFETHRTMFIALVNQTNTSVIGYLGMPINQQFMVDKYLQPALVETFGSESNSALDVWLRNWTSNTVIASSNSDNKFNIEIIEFVQQFPDFFDDWRMFASVNESSVIASSQPSLLSNLIVLGAAFIFLVGAMIFMFITAQRERALADRQSGFLANVTHELKTPLAVMQAAGENLADGRVDNQERLKSYGSHIYSEAVRLRKMIEKLLDVAKADAGESFIHPKQVNIKKHVNKFIDEHRAYIEGKGFTLDISVPDDRPTVMLDIHSLNTILSNLSNNAIKYSNDDKVLGIYLSQKGKDAILQVKDRGVGISKNSIKHIFEKFYRVEDSLTAQTKGYGLGLSIVKNLVELNGGTINVSSQPGKGTIFTVTFPVIDAPDKPKNHTVNSNVLRNTQQKTRDYAN